MVKNIIILLITSLLFVASYYVGFNLASTNFEEILFYSLSKNQMTFNKDDAIIIALRRCLPFIIGLFIFLYITIYKIDVYPLTLVREHSTLFIIILFIFSLLYLFKNIGLFNYLYYNMHKSDLIKENYIDPHNVDITFNKKRNLIMIFVESLENTIFSKEQGGVWDDKIINELYDILKDENTVSFYQPNSTQGMHMLQCTSYTSSSIFANNLGVPAKIGLKRKGYTKNKYMSGAYGLGELLKENNYTNEVISAALTNYGGLCDFYKKHGDFHIIDINSLNDYGINIKKSDKCNWGFNDNCLFEIAKKRLDILAKNNKPFDLQLITIDTHFVDGFIGDYSETKFKRQYENAYATTSRLIKEFIDYVKGQPFYKDTTIVIVGDHLIMQSDFMNDKMSNNRTIYNAIINSGKKADNPNHIYTALDSFPTIISALGANIPGNKLSLGTNLFSSEKTLAEKYGVKTLNNELKKKSSFYDEKILEIKK